MPAQTKEASVDVTLPEKQSYRVSNLGASYLDPVQGIRPDGSVGVVQVYRVGRFGETIDLTADQATRLLDLGVVKPSDDPLSYEEMTIDQLRDRASERGVTVQGSGANGAVLKDDLVNALTTYDQGVTGPFAPPAS